MTDNEWFAALLLVGIVGLVGPWATLAVLVLRARRRDQRAAMRRALGLDLERERTPRQALAGMTVVPTARVVGERPDGVLFGWRP